MTQIAMHAFTEYTQKAEEYLIPTTREFFSAFVASLDTPIYDIEVLRTGGMNVFFEPRKLSIFANLYPGYEAQLSIRTTYISTDEMVDLDVNLTATGRGVGDRIIISTPGYRLWIRSQTGHDAGADLARVVDKYCYKV